MQDTVIPPPTPSTAPPPSMYSRSLHRERIDRAILRSLGEFRISRTLRSNGRTSAWDDLERLVSDASTTLWEVCPLMTPVGEELAAFCAFLARELEINEQMDLPSDRDLARLKELSPRALRALDSIMAPLVLEDRDPAMRSLGAVFGKLRGLLFKNAGSGLFKFAA